MGKNKKISADELFMQRAIDSARCGCKAGLGGPFGACIVKNNKIIAASCNKVLKNNDPTAHAEINAIRQAAKILKTYDLSGCRIYSTTEPCPMCFAAIHWAKIKSIVYGTKISDVSKRGFNELIISSNIMRKIGNVAIDIAGNFMRKQCRELLKYWDKLSLKKIY